MKPKIFLISLGCPRNLVDSETLVGKLKKKGFRVFHEFKEHSVAIVNTCGFIEDAKSESIDLILQMAELRKKGRIARLIVTGCLSQRYSEYLMNEIGEIDGVFGSSSFTGIPEYMDSILSGKRVIVIDKKPRFLYDHATPRFIMTPRHSVYIKIQEGCRNFCSYCVIPKIRGPFRSRSMGSVLKEITSLKESGAREINLIGQDTTLFGVDRYKRPRLAGLLRKASRVMKSGWVRLLYTHPAHYNQELIGVIRNEPSVCKYLDLPIQHISDKILRKMNRHVTRKDIVSLIARLRKNIPGLAIRTSLIVGFPGETDRDFSELENFIKEAKFERLGVFIYSREEDTRAHGFAGHVPQKEKAQRFDRIMEAQREISGENNKAYLGKTVRVLIDLKDRNRPGQYMGRTQHDAPEVDGLVYVKSRRALRKGDFVNVTIEDTLEYDLVGKA
jgi:ribosomal protein S12 methylthiotransferase